MLHPLPHVNCQFAACSLLNSAIHPVSLLFFYLLCVFGVLVLHHTTQQLASWGRAVSSCFSVHKITSVNITGTAYWEKTSFSCDLCGIVAFLEGFLFTWNVIFVLSSWIIQRNVYMWTPESHFLPHCFFSPKHFFFLCFYFNMFSGSQLNAQLEDWLSKAQSRVRPARAIIAP